MSSVFTCKNGHQMQSPGSPPGTAVACPTCQEVTFVPRPDTAQVVTAYPVEGHHGYQQQRHQPGQAECPPHTLVPSDEISVVAWGICLLSGCWCFCPLCMDEFKKKRCTTCQMRFEMWEDTNVRPPQAAHMV
eukprot:gb/GEZN01029165.1/.p1 GENE.gb/GEZN01029165.1/~~gb/GEZN01029165.1/.p1  ORF type:complete len:132 (-),score=11.36 gb/GEZN01029165.1/:48-443(-)